MPEIKRPLDFVRENIVAVSNAGEREGICVSLNYVEFAFVFLHEQVKYLESERQVGKKEIIHVNDRPNRRYVNSDT